MHPSTFEMKERNTSRPLNLAKWAFLFGMQICFHRIFSKIIKTSRAFQPPTI